MDLKIKSKTFPSNYRYKKNAFINNKQQYNIIYNQSISDSDRFWSETANRISWFKKWSNVSNVDFTKAEISWFEGGKLNASYNCLDRHVESGHGNQTALIWEGNNPLDDRSFTYKELLFEVGRFSNVLKSHDIKKGDRVCIYMQMVPELVIAMLACARIGAIHSIVFGAFSADSLSNRINDSQCKLLVTQDTGIRGKKNNIPMKSNCDDALTKCPTIKTVVVVKRTNVDVKMKHKRDVWWHEEMNKDISDYCEPEQMDAEDPLFILYTSGSTGTPKGVLHSTGGYMVYTSYTHQMIFDYQENDIYWCTADIGWITGHSYIVYGPLSNRATTVMFEGVPNYPDFGRFWQIVEKHKINIFYTAPTALRALMKEGNDFVTKHNLSSLKLLGTVGEPIKEAEWSWYYNVVGNQQCPIVDTWWQTETGGILITPLPAITDLKPGSATKPFFGIEPVILDENGKVLDGPAEGLLAIKKSWPGQMRTIYGDHKRFFDTYFSQFKGYYFTGDGVKRDKDGYYWITGRVDDVLNVSGHRLGTAEIEGALGAHKSVAEAAVVGFNHEIKGQGVYAFITLMTGEISNDNMEDEIKLKVREIIGPHATPDKIQFTEGLPKTRSGKIMRRILRNIAEGQLDELGDISTLADPSIVDKLVLEKQ